MNQTVADERGVDWIKIIPQNYKSTERMEIKIIEYNWSYSTWWRTYNIGMVIFGIFSFIAAAMTTPNMIEKINAKYDDKIELPLGMLAIFDVYKDIVYITRFPHFSPVIDFFLYFAITAPFTIVYNLNNNTLVANTSLL